MNAPKYTVSLCEDTGKPALYQRIDSNKPGAISGWQLIAHESDLAPILIAIRDHLNAKTE